VWLLAEVGCPDPYLPLTSPRRDIAAEARCLQNACSWRRFVRMSAVTILIARSARGQRSAEVGREPRFQSDARNRRFGRSARAGYPGGFDAHHDGRAGG
jgi:hypothetical protein